MKLLLGVLLIVLPTAAVADVTPEMAQRVLKLLEQAEAAPEEALDGLARLARQARRADDVAFVVKERAALLIQQDRLDLARQEMAATLEGRPDDYAPELRSLYASTLLVSEDYAGALKELQLWEAHTDRPHPGGLFLLGFVYVQLERFEEAVAVLERTVNTDFPARDQWIELLAYAYTRTGRPGEAVALLKSLIAEHPDRARWWNRLAGVYMLMDQVPTGTASMTVSGLLDDLTYADARRLARLYSHLGMPADGAELMSRAMEAREEPAGYEDLMLLGELWMLARETDRAIDTFRAAQALADQGEPAMMIGQLYAQREDYAPARAALLTAVAAYGEDTPPQVHYLLAIVEINLGDLDAASDSVAHLLGDEKYRERGESLAAHISNALSQR